MDWQIAGILMQDGVTSGAIYALLALALVLVFSVTRVIFIPQGEFVAYGALTLAAIQAGHVPNITWLLVAMGIIVFTLDTGAFLRSRDISRTAGKRLTRSLAKNLAFPISVHLVVPHMATTRIWCWTRSFRKP